MISGKIAVIEGNIPQQQVDAILRPPQINWRVSDSRPYGRDVLFQALGFNL